MKTLLTAALCGVTLAAGIGAAETAQAQPGYYRDYGGRGWNNNYRWNDRRYYRNRDDGAIAALAAGALIGSVVAQGGRGYYGDSYYRGGYYDRGYYGRPYRMRCYSQRVWDPYWGGYEVRRVCR